MPEHQDPLLGTVLDRRYRVLTRIGEGGFGAVYTVQHVHTGKYFAVKVLHPEFARDQHITERFWREAQAASLIEHENVVDIIDIGQTREGTLYFSMELLRGEPLSALLDREGPLPWSRVRVFALQIARALCAAHAKGIIHRDLKPENCIRVQREDNPDFIKVLDFGIAKIVHASAPEALNLTSRGEVLGTPQYMAPEQAAGSPVDARVDVFSFGVLLFELLTGSYPFSGETRIEILTKILTTTPPRVSSVAPAARVPASIDDLIARALHREPEQRPSMAEVLAAIQSADGRSVAPRAAAPPPKAPVNPRPPVERAATIPRSARSRRRVAAAGGTLGVAVFAGALFMLTRPSSSEPVPAATESVPTLEVAPVEPPPAAAPAPAPVPETIASPGPGPSPAAVDVPPAAQEVNSSSSPAPAPSEVAAQPVRELPKAAKKKPPPPPPPPPPPAITPPTCADALVKIAARAGGAMTQCKGSTGISTGDRVKIRLTGSAVTGKARTLVVSSSGSVAFDNCLVAALESVPFPRTVSGVPTCSQDYPLKVP